MTSGRRCRCGTSLAHDNAGMLCAVCQHKRLASRHRAPEIPPDFWHTDAMADALASGDLGRVILAYRSHPFHGRRPLSQSVVADWLHVSQTSLSRIEHGKCRLTIDDIRQFAGALGLSVALRWSPETEVGEDVDPLSRRSLFGAGVGAAVGLRATTAPAAARQIDPDLVAHWIKLLHVLGRHDAIFGAHDVLATVRRELGLIAEHREIARGALRTDLLRVEARWAEFAGWLSDDAGDSRMYDYWTERALRLAQESGYHDMIAWALMLQSRQAASEDEPGRAIGLANAARRTHGTSDQSRALSTLRVAHGQAVANDAASFERTLAEAYARLHALDQTTRADDLGAEYVTRAYVVADEARCWLRLRPRKAITMFEDALRLWPHDRTRGRGIHTARLALACAAAGEPERAVVEGIKAVGIAQNTKSDLTMRELKLLDDRLAGCDVPAAADFREAFATL